MVSSRHRANGFTIVELLIVIVVIGILAAITIVAYSGAQSRAQDSSTLSAVTAVNKAVLLYYATYGEYPKTTSLSNGRSDANCAVGTKQSDWVPGIVPEFIPTLPLSPARKSADNAWDDCYLYASDGISYVLSAWRMVKSGPQKAGDIRRSGFREGWTASQGSPISYYCANGTSRSYWDKYYHYSYTFTNVTGCNET